MFKGKGGFKKNLKVAQDGLKKRPTERPAQLWRLAALAKRQENPSRPINGIFGLKVAKERQAPLYLYQRPMAALKENA